MLNVLTPAVVADWMGLEPFTKREATDMNLILTIGAQIFVTAGFFCSTSFFYKEKSDKNLQETKRFFDDLETPVVAGDDQDSYDLQQRRKLGTMVVFMGVSVTLMALIPNVVWGRIMFLSCAAVILSIGVFLRKSAVDNTLS